MSGTASNSEANALQATHYEKILAIGAIALLALVLTALAKGRAEWQILEPLVWIHLITVLTPLALTPVQLLRRHGDRTHRVLGWVWAASLFATAILSFGIRQIEDGALSFIHVFSVVTIVTVPPLVLAARHHKIAAHRRSVRRLVTGALLVTGYFTLIPGRDLGDWLWG